MSVIGLACQFYANKATVPGSGLIDDQPCAAVIAWAPTEPAREGELPRVNLSFFDHTGRPRHARGVPFAPCRDAVPSEVRDLGGYAVICQCGPVCDHTPEGETLETGHDTPEGETLETGPFGTDTLTGVESPVPRPDDAAAQAQVVTELEHRSEAAVQRPPSPSQPETDEEILERQGTLNAHDQSDG